MTMLEARGRNLQSLVRQWERERPDLDVTPFWFVGAIMQLAQKFENEFRDFGRTQFGIGAGDLRILLALRRSGPPYAMRSTDLFESLLLSAGAVSKQVDRLTEQGYVDRIRAHGTQGQRLVALTEKGVHVTNTVQEVIATSFCDIAPVLSSLSAEKLRTLTTTLEKLLNENTSLGVGAAPVNGSERAAAKRPSAKSSTPGTRRAAAPKSRK